MTAPFWNRRAERGSAALVRLMIWLTLRLGWRVGTALLYPITLYYFASAPAARAASRAFLARALGRAPTLAERFRHLFCFAAVLLDRVFFLTGRTDRFHVTVSGLDALKATLAAGRGCLLFGAHLGSFEAFRPAARLAPVRLRPLMYRGNAGPLSTAIARLAPELDAAVIDIGTPDAMLRVRESLAAGEMVGVLADRTPDGQKSVSVPFLGQDAAFPAGPFILAAAVDAPVLLFFGLRTGPRRYELHFEPFTDRIVLQRATRPADLHRVVSCFAERLAAQAKAHPFNWFNFYDFWALTVRDGAVLANRARKSTAGRRWQVLLPVLLLLAGLPRGWSAPAPLLDQVMHHLAAVGESRAAFTEQKTIAALAQPLHDAGRLIYRRPGYLEKLTDAPRRELLVVDQGELTLTEANGARKAIDLAEHPALAALVGAILGTLSGDQASLRHWYQLSIAGTLDAWTLILTPAEASVARLLRQVTIIGRGAQLRELRYVQPNGDVTQMTIQPAA